MIKTPSVWLLSVLLLAACTQTQSQTSAGPQPIGPNTLNVADAAIAGGDPNMALSVAQSVLATDSGNVDALVHEGDAYYALDRCPAAMAAYQLALTHDPKASVAETGLGRCLLKTDPHSAEAAFEAAVQDDPGNANALNDLGIARDLQGNFTGAVDPYQKALMADPSLTAAEVNLGLSLALSGNAPEALQYLGPLAISQQATPKIREDYAAALVATGRDAEARQVLAIDLPPDDVNKAIAGFAALIAQSQAPPPPPPPPGPTVTTVTTTQVSAAPIAQSSSLPAPLVPAVIQPPAKPAVSPLSGGDPPAPLVPAVIQSPAYVPDNSTAAYTGPSPIPVTASSSTPGPAITLPASIPAPEPTASPQPIAAAQKTPASIAPAVGAGSAGVQLGALNSPGDAERAWRSISDAVPVLFKGKEPQIEPATIKDKTFYRLRLGGFANQVGAAKFCAEVSAAGCPCTLADF